MCYGQIDDMLRHIWLMTIIHGQVSLADYML